MGLFDFLPCCGPRREKRIDGDTVQESASLLPPAREESIISADGLSTGNYGAIEQGLTDEQRLRIEAIGREVGGQMLPIQSLPPGHSQRASPSLSRHNAHEPTPSSRDSSRPSSPSPLRPETSPPDGIMQTPEKDGEEGVVRKQLFAGGMSNRKISGRGKGKTRGKGRK